MSNLRWPDLLIVIIYMASMVYMGLRFSRRQTSTETYFVAKRSIPSWAMGISLFAMIKRNLASCRESSSAFAGVSHPPFGKGAI